MITSLPETEVLRACQTLFGTRVRINRGFLFNLQPEGLKAAYRKQAKQTHPDFFACESPNIQQQQTALFRDVVDAYDVVNRYFKQREKRACASSSSPAPAHRSPRKPNKKSWHPANNMDGPAGPSVHEALPLRSLQFGQYLYYRGFITYRGLIDAVVWQRRQRPVIGDIALRWSWLNPASIEWILQAGGLRGRFGEKASALGLLTPFQIRVLLSFQRSRQKRLGTYFVEHRIMKAEKLELLVQELHAYNMRFRTSLSARNKSEA